MHLYVHDFMSTALITVRPEATLRQASKQLEEHRIRHLLVMEEGDLVGIVTDRDVRQALPALPFVSDFAEMLLKMDQVKVRDIMSRELVAISPDVGLEAAVDLFLARRISALPVVERQRVLGILTVTDALRGLRLLLPVAPGGQAHVAVASAG